MTVRPSTDIDEIVHLGRTPGARAWWRSVAGGERRAAGWGAVLESALVMLSIPYGLAVAGTLFVRSRSAVRLDVPVVSVGNLVVGGTGKTPLVVYVARELQRMGRRVAVVSRGYGRSSDGTLLVSRGERPLVSWRKAGDEPYLLALLLSDVGVIVAERRVDGIREAVERLDADVVVLDDAFQHVQVERDLDIVAVDASSPVGNGFLLPAGPLREHPLGVGRADVLVATRSGEDGAKLVESTLGPLAPGAAVVATRMKPVELWDARTGARVAPGEVRGRDVVALAGIAGPDDFFRTVERIGANVVARLAAPDHHEYDEGDLKQVEDAARSTGARAVLTTEKDAVRLSEWTSPVPVVALGIDMEIIKGRRALLEALADATTRRSQ
ncbi:MAG: tetraacyldisaccharide 4'-kinase [Candidatus Eisenbacteria bacterium]|nr:tetraacyldisaccharide 4'-kinase [Candidatus Eisenbacteria bacterium]